MTSSSSSSSSSSSNRIHLPRPHPGQIAVRRSMRRFNWLCAGRRWRKTTLDMSVMVEAAVQGGEYIWGAPTFQQVRVGWNEMRRACGDLVLFNESRMEARFPDPGNGRPRGLVHFVSLDDPDNARGFTADGIVLDEASEIAAVAWHQTLRPMLMDTNGWLLATFTPKGRNWTWAAVTEASHGDDPESIAWQVPSLGCVINERERRLERAPHPLENPDLPFSELEKMYATMPQRDFEQEILAVFLDDIGGAFRGVEACVGGSLEDAPPNAVYEYAIGLDLAKWLDYTVAVVVDLRARRVVAFERYNKADWTLQKERIKALAARWNNATVWMDATGVGDPIYDDLLLAGLRVHPYKFTSATKMALLNNAILMVEKREISYPRIPVLLDELKALQYKRTESGILTLEAPEGMHDDAVMAFALALWPLGHALGTGLLTAAMVNASVGKPYSDIGGVRLMNKVF